MCSRAILCKYVFKIQIERRRRISGAWDDGYEVDKETDRGNGHRTITEEARMSKTLVITNQKGGVGKTTTASAVVSGLADLGYKILAVDLDPQGNLGFCLGAEIDNSPTVYEMMKGSITAEKVIQHCGGIDVMPSNILLSGAELEFTNIGREYLLKKALDPVKDSYDFIVVDTPPALNILTVNAYTATDKLVIPMVPRDPEPSRDIPAERDDPAGQGSVQPQNRSPGDPSESL